MVISRRSASSRGVPIRCINISSEISLENAQLERYRTCTYHFRRNPTTIRIHFASKLYEITFQPQDPCRSSLQMFTLFRVGRDLADRSDLDRFGRRHRAKVFYESLSERVARAGRQGDIQIVGWKAKKLTLRSRSAQCETLFVHSSLLTLSRTQPPAIRHSVAGILGPT
jgi:hypothetical protein